MKQRKSVNVHTWYHHRYATVGGLYGYVRTKVWLAGVGPDSPVVVASNQAVRHAAEVVPVAPTS